MLPCLPARPVLGSDLPAAPVLAALSHPSRGWARRLRKAGRALRPPASLEPVPQRPLEVPRERLEVPRQPHPCFPAHAQLPHPVPAFELRVRRLDPRADRVAPLELRRGLLLRSEEHTSE